MKKDKPQVIKTNRLILKDITNQDKENLITILKDKEVGKTYMVPTLDSKEKEDKIFARFKEIANDPSRFLYGIYLNDNLIGFINDVEITSSDIELGFVINPLYKNNGYATEALTKAIEVLFDIGYSNVVTGVFKENLASSKVMIKSGMLKQDKITFEPYNGVDHECIWYIKSK